MPELLYLMMLVSFQASYIKAIWSSFIPHLIFVRTQITNRILVINLAWLGLTAYKPKLSSLIVTIMDRVSTKFKTRQDEIGLVSECVIMKMENNPNFPNPPEAFAELKIASPEYQQALKDAMSGDKQMTAIKNNKKAIVLDLLEVLADYVTVTCEGNRALILSSGFDAEETGNGGKLSSSNIKLEVELGEMGEATTRVKNVRGARAYVHEYTTEPPTVASLWVSEGWAQSSYTFKKLSVDKRYWFRVVVIGSGTQRVYSPVVSRVVQ